MESNQANRLNLSATHNRLPRRSLLWFAAGLFLLSFLSAWYFKLQPSVNFQQKLLEKYIAAEERDGSKLLQDTALMRKLVLQTESLEEFKKIADKKYGVFLFAETISDNQDILFWNNQKILPPNVDFSLPDGEYFQHLTNGYYVVVKTTLKFKGMSNNILAYITIPVLSEYYLQTNYLLTQFAHDKDAINKIALSEQRTDFPIHSLKNKTLFYIKRVTNINVIPTDTLTIVLRITALLSLLIYLHLIAERLVKRKTWYGILFLVAALLIARLFLYEFGNIFSFRQFHLFDPTVFGTNQINRSLGDLLINSILLCWIVLFAWYNIGPVKKLPALLKGNRIYAAGFLALFVLIFSTFQFANMVRSLVLDSKISFNVTDFFSLDFYTVVGLIILALLSLCYYYFSRLLFRFIFPAFQNRYLYIYFFIALIGLIFLTFRSGNSIVLFHLPVLLWLVIYTLLVSQENFIINRFKITIAGALFWIFVFSVSLSAIIIQGNRESELITRKAIAEKYDQITDPTNVHTLSIATAYLNNRFLLNNFDRFKDPEQNRFLRDSIIRENFTPGYTTSYDTRIYVFDSLHHPVNNDDAMTYPELNTIFTTQSKPTAIPDVRYHETSFEKYTYITRRVISDSTDVTGSFFILSTPRQYGNSDALYPELFRAIDRSDMNNSPIYSYAIYNNNLLASSSSKYSFPISLTADQIPKSEFETRKNGSYDELWYKASNKKIVVIAKKSDTVIESITLFSYLFCAFLFMVGLLQVISVVIRLISERHTFSLFSHFTIRTQIQGTVIFISILSFLIIGAATISFFISRYNTNNVDKLSRTAGIMVKELQKRLSDTSAFSPDFQDSASIENLKKLVTEVADIHDVDVNIYDTEGNLEVSSDEDVYDKGILSTKMHPMAYYHLDRLREVEYVQDETLSSLNYLSIYAIVRNDKGDVLAYLNVPYFSSQIDLKQEISNFLVTIINLNAFIFLIAGVIALFITNKITQSFSVIGDKMKEITLGKTNEEIVWNKNDEIGDLVLQYNKMVHQLEASAEALAKSEREGAWREMARQVAHEIKNPLTPMKLSIQYLQKAINSNQSNVKELTANVANTLIEQIDHLSKIAADFSQFANISNKKIELVDLHQVIGILIDLYSSNPKINIQWNKVAGSVIMKADKTQMNRVFTNLLANAVDACMANEKCEIEINELKEEDSIVISIKDNGEGIPEDTRSKIFIPNFTTKTSGTGLGLAMCKGIIEQAQGRIWFETEEGKGATFFVELPVIN